MFCKYCGKEIEDHSVFCEYCGKKQTEDQGKDGDKTPQNSSFYNKNIKPEKKKKTKKSVGKGVSIFVIIIVVVVLYFALKSWKPWDDDPSEKDKIITQENSEKETGTEKNDGTQNQYDLEEILQSDRWIMGPIDEDQYMAFEFLPDGTGYIETALLLAGNLEIPGWSSEEWVHSDGVFNFDYEVDDDWAYIDVYDEDGEQLEMEMNIFFTLKGVEITTARIYGTSPDGESYVNTLPVCADPDLQ